MNIEKLKFIALLLFVAGLTGLDAQIVVPATGGNALGVGGSVSYSVGQVVYTACTGANGSVAQGVQQPFEISTLTGLNEVKGKSLSCSIYPNPTIDFVQLKVDVSTTFSIQAMSYQIFDTQGKLLESKKLESNITNIAMNNFGTATYFLKVLKGNKEIETFKIIKN